MLTKNKKLSLKNFNSKDEYSIDKAIDIIRNITYTKFDSSFDLSISLDITFRKSEHLIEDFVLLPYGTGKHTKILVFCEPEKEVKIKDLNVDYFGLENYIKKIKNGWLDFDVIITTPELMSKLVEIGKILGPKKLMPSFKSNTITLDIAKSVKDIRIGRVNFKIDKTGILNTSIGRFSFSNKQIKDNLSSLVNKIITFKTSLKSFRIKNIVLSSTMSQGVHIDKKCLFNN
jgi:large subunit ribosomal protein L1